MTEVERHFIHLIPRNAKQAIASLVEIINNPEADKELRLQAARELARIARMATDDE